MIVRLVIFAFVLASVLGCGTRYSPTYCSNEVVYILDTSTTTDASTVQNMLNFFSNRITPWTYFNPQKVAFMAYGVSTSPDDVFLTPPYTTNVNDACTELQTIQNLFNNQTYKRSVNLTQVLETYYNTYYLTAARGSPVILFTANSNYDDIVSAGNYARNNLYNANFVIVSIAYYVYLFQQYFPALAVFNVDSRFSDPSFENCIADYACLNTFSSYCYGSTTAFYDEWTTAQPITEMETTTGQTTEPTGCSDCNFYQIWNDVVYVIDASESTGNVGLQEMWGAIQSISDSFNIQRSDYSGTSYTMRVGVVRYASQAEVLYPLGSLNNADIDNKNFLPFYSEDYETNLEAALQLAVAQFDEVAHRSNSRKVIVVMSAGYRPGAYNKPDTVSKSFQGDNGVVVVYQYGRGDGAVDSEMQAIASPGYFIYGPSSSLSALQTAQCDANCFCPQPYVPYSSDNNRNTPSGGCYTASELQGNYAVAKRFCSKFANGFPATDKSSNQNNFLMSLFYGPKTFYIGLTWDTFYRKWVWPNGQQYSGYAPWYNGYEPYGSSLQCVYVSQSGYWVNVDCKTSMYYTCEAKPCDSNHYCNISL